MTWYRVSKRNTAKKERHYKHAGMKAEKLFTGAAPAMPAAAAGRAAGIQRKAAIASETNPLEDEVDEKAHRRIMRMPESPFIQRKCAACEKEEQVQRKPLASFIQKTQQPLLQRRWKMMPRSGTNPLNRGGQTDEQLLEDGFKEICPRASRSGNFITIAPGTSPAARTAGCDCLDVIDRSVGGLLATDPEVQVEPFGWSNTRVGSGGARVSVRHPEDPFSWGYWTGTTSTHPSETRHLKPFWQTLAHEICGHVAAFVRSGGGAAGARGVGTGHNVAIAGENTVAAEHGVTTDEQRGMDMTSGGTPLAGHRGESFLQAVVNDFDHTMDTLPASTTGVVSSLVNTVRTTAATAGLDMLMQVEGFATVNEGGLTLAASRAANVRAEIERALTAAGILLTAAGASRFSTDLASLSPGFSYPLTSDAGRVVKVYLFHQPHSAGP